MANETKAVDVQTKDNGSAAEKRETCGGLVNKLCQVMAEAGYVQKRGRNEKFNYSYATEADVVDSLREKLAARNVFVFPSVISAERKFHAKTASGAEMHITDIMVKWTFVDGETGETHECMMPGCGTDTGDKSVYKAITGSSKYLFLKAFMLPTGDDPEDEMVDREEGKQAAKNVATAKLKEHANGDETIVLTPWKQGRIALSGNGVAIIRSALTEEEKRELGIVLDPRENVVHIPVANTFRFVDACVKHNVPTVHMDAQTQKGPVRANIPAMPEDPIIKAAKIVQAGGKVKHPFLAVEWNGKKLSCFEHVSKQNMKPLWDLVVANVGKPADFAYVQNGAYFNIEGIKRLNGHDFAAEQAALDAGTLQPEIGEYLEPTFDAS